MSAIAVFTGAAPGFRPTPAGHPWRLIVAPLPAPTGALTGIGARPSITFDHKADALLHGAAIVDHLAPFFDWMTHP